MRDRTWRDLLSAADDLAAAGTKDLGVFFDVGQQQLAPGGQPPSSRICPLKPYLDLKRLEPTAALLGQQLRCIQSFAFAKPTPRGLSGAAKGGPTADEASGGAGAAAGSKRWTTPVRTSPSKADKVQPSWSLRRIVSSSLVSPLSSRHRVHLSRVVRQRFLVQRVYCPAAMLFSHEVIE
jgi:hypothetical protein